MERFTNKSPGALTMEQAIARHKKRVDEDRRQRQHARELAAQGRGADTEIAHFALGELVVPHRLQTPEFMAALGRAAAEHDIPLEMLSIGNALNSINPNTGAAEFSFAWLDRFKNRLSQDKTNASTSGGAMADLPSVRNAAKSYDFTLPGADATSMTPDMGDFMSRTIDIAKDGPGYQVFGPDNAETVRRARVIFGETGGVYPALQNPQGKVFDENNWVPGSADELARARAHIGTVSARNPVTHSAEPDLSKHFDRHQWNNALEAARASRALDNTLSKNVDGFFMRQDGTNQNIPNYDKLFQMGPFYTVGGHNQVGPGNRMYVDFHPKLYHPRKQ